MANRLLCFYSVFSKFTRSRFSCDYRIREPLAFSDSTR
jgi:hypothetical protein